MAVLQVMAAEESKTEDDTCNEPEQYNIDNPAEVECEEGDEECLSVQEESVVCDPESDETCLIDSASDSDSAEQVLKQNLKKQRAEMLFLIYFVLFKH